MGRISMATRDEVAAAVSERYGEPAGPNEGPSWGGFGIRAESDRKEPIGQKLTLFSPLA